MSPFNLGTRFKNMASGRGFAGDVKVKKLDRFKEKQSKLQAKEAYHTREKELNRTKPEHVRLDVD